MRELKFFPLNVKPLRLIVIILILFLFKPFNCYINYVLCPDQKSACPNGNICCEKGTGYRCCPEDLVCCRDGTYCCTPDFLNNKHVIASLEILIPNDIHMNLKEEKIVESSNSSFYLISSKNYNTINNNEEKCVEYIKKSVVIPITNILNRQEDFFSLLDMRLLSFLRDLDLNCKDEIKDLKKSFISDLQEKLTLKNLLDKEQWKNLKEDLKFFLSILEKNIFQHNK